MNTVDPSNRTYTRASVVYTSVSLLPSIPSSQFRNDHSRLAWTWTPASTLCPPTRFFWSTRLRCALFFLFTLFLFLFLFAYPAFALVYWLVVLILDSHNLFDRSEVLLFPPFMSTVYVHDCISCFKYDRLQSRRMGAKVYGVLFEREDINAPLQPLQYPKSVCPLSQHNFKPFCRSCRRLSHQPGW